MTECDENIAELRSLTPAGADRLFTDLADWHIDRDTRYASLKKVIQSTDFDHASREELGQLARRFYPEPDPEKDEFAVFVLESTGDMSCKIGLLREMTGQLLRIALQEL